MDKAKIKQRILSLGYDETYADEMIAMAEDAAKEGVAIPDTILFAPPPIENPGYPASQE